MEIRDFIEHDEIPADLVLYFKENPDKEFRKRFYTYHNNKHKLSYFIGAQWLEKDSDDDDKKLAVIVRPKIEDIDFMKMFIQCLQHGIEGFSDIYAIDFEAPPIGCKDHPSLPKLDPLMAAHFLYLLKPLLSKGLKRSFIQREENLSSKIKGKLLFNANLKANGVKGRADRAYCRFSEISTDCLENRILKKALRICETTLSLHKQTDLETIFSHCRSFFEGISEEVAYPQLLHLKINPLYREYKPALRVAVDIIRRRRLSEGQNQMTPPYWIDMALLFEKYVYGLMLDDRDTWGEVAYQQSFDDAGTPDFLVPKKGLELIADTKYKPNYTSGSISLDDARQLAGYSRYMKIRERLGFSENSSECVPCLIIFPDQDSRFDLGDKIADDRYCAFHKLGVPLPIKEAP